MGVNIEIIDFKVKSMFGDCTPSMALKVLAEACDIMMACKSLHGYLTVESSKPEYTDLQLDACEQLEMVLRKAQYMQAYADSAFIQEPVLYSRIRTFCDVAEQAQNALSTIALMGIDLRQQDINLLTNMCELMLDVIPFFILCEFNVLETHASLPQDVRGDVTIRVNEIVFTYLENNTSFIEEFCYRVIDMNMKFRKPIPMFDLPEEVVDAFYEQADIYAQKLELYIGHLTMSDIEAVANGSLDAQELLRLTMDRITESKQVMQPKQESVMDAF